MKKLYLLLLITGFVLLATAPVFAAVPGVASMGDLYESILAVARGWRVGVSQYALGLMGVVAVIAFVMGCKDLVLSGGINAESITALLVRQIFVVGLITWLLRDSRLLLLIPESLTALGVHVGGAEPSMDGVVSAFDSLVTPITNYYSTLSFNPVSGKFAPGEAIVCIILVFFIYCLMVLFATTVLLVQIETIFILVGGLITAAFFVIGQFRDIFMGYIKALFMNGLKLLLLSLVLGLFLNIMSGWGTVLSSSLLLEPSYDYRTSTWYTAGTGAPPPTNPSALYSVAIPMVFGLMAFYIVLKSVPQYAVAILTGHASADGSLGKAAVMAGIAAGTTVWNTSRGISNTALNTASTVNNAANAYKNAAQSVIDSGGSTAKALGFGTWSAVKAALSTSVDGGGGLFGGGGGGGGRGSGGGGSGGGTGANEMKPGGALDPQKASAGYDDNNKKS